MIHACTLKVYKIIDTNGEFETTRYKVGNAEKVIAMDLQSGDILKIKGIGTLEIIGSHYSSEKEGANPYEHLELVTLL